MQKSKSSHLLNVPLLSKDSCEYLLRQGSSHSRSSSTSNLNINNNDINDNSGSKRSLFYSSDNNINTHETFIVSLSHQGSKDDMIGMSENNTHYANCKNSVKQKQLSQQICVNTPKNAMICVKQASCENSVFDNNVPNTNMPNNSFERHVQIPYQLGTMRSSLNKTITLITVPQSMSVNEQLLQ